jgi:hypothetical protein
VDVELYEGLLMLQVRQGGGRLLCNMLRCFTLPMLHVVLCGA